MSICQAGLDNEKLLYSGLAEVVDYLSGKLKRGSLRYGEAVELADALGYDCVFSSIIV